MELLFYPVLSTRSKRAMKRRRSRGGRPYMYKPRQDLLENLAAKYDMGVEQVHDQLIREHLYLKNL